MKSKTLLIGMSALLVSGMGANAMEYKPFIGLTSGIQGVFYDNDFEDQNRGIDLPKDFLAIGLETGARFGSYQSIYNGGFTISADTSTKQSAETKISNDTVAHIKTTEFAATYDNYIRISGDKIKRIDLVLGGGLGAMNYHIDYAASDKDETIWSTAIVFKIGADFELTKHLTLSAMSRVFIPTRNHYAAESEYIAGGAIKYVF